jgi:hypothetical protein
MNRRYPMAKIMTNLVDQLEAKYSQDPAFAHLSEVELNDLCTNLVLDSMGLKEMNLQAE